MAELRGLALVTLVATFAHTFAQSNPITTISQPTRGATYYYGGQINLTFQVTQNYDRSTGFLGIELMRGGSSTACPLVRYPYHVLTTPPTILIDVPDCAPPDTNYQISLQAAPNFELRSQLFSLAVRAGAPCAAGSFDAADGTEPGCALCPIGTYSTSTRVCTACPSGMSTYTRGATAVGACNRTLVNASLGFARFDKTFFYHSNAGGLNLIQYDHKTPEECMALCNQNAGCKAVDIGDLFQSGDCFLSYDNTETIKTGDVRFVNQLELYLKVDRQTVRDVFFQKRTGCYIQESNDGGVFRDEHSPEACGQLCLNQKMCLSYDAGQVRGDPTGNTRWIATIDDCYLSFENRAAVPSNQFVCNYSQGLDYYERVVPRYFEIGAAYDSVVTPWNGQFQSWLPVNQNFTWWNDNATYAAQMNSLRCQCNRRTIAGIGGSCRRWGSYGGSEPWCHVNPTCAAANRTAVPNVAGAFWARCFVPVLPCPVAWNSTAEVVDRYPFLSSRDNFIDAAKQAFASRLNNLNVADIAARLEPNTDARGAPQSSQSGVPQTMMLTVNVWNGNRTSAADAAFANAFTVGQTVSVTIGTRQYPVTQRNPVPCADGYVSQSGYAPGCSLCPPDSVQNRARTNCVECPLGTVSNAGEFNQFTANTTGLKACRPSFNSAQFNLGVFRVGYEWSGYYTNTPLGVDGQGRMGNGALSIQVTRSEYNNFLGAVDVEILVTVHHGEDCPPRRNCRDPGITQYYANAQVSEGSSAAYFQKNNSGNSWHGITDRNTRLFVPATLDGNVRVLNRNNVFSGSFEVLGSGSGQFVLWERCYGSDEAGGFLPGNKFVGTYACYRPGTDMTIQTSGNDPCLASREGNLPALNVRRLELTVVENTDGVVTAEVGFNFASTQGQYEVTGQYNATTGAIVFNAGQGAWISAHPWNVPARQLSLALSDNGETLNGQYNANPNCACNGTAILGQGATCTAQRPSFDNRIPAQWCTVDPACADGRPVANMPNTYVGPCNVFPNSPSSTSNLMETCSNIDLYRVCSSSPPLCESGWQFFPGQFRCYQSSLRLNQSHQTANFSTAQAICASKGATLASIHSNPENAFVRGLTGGQVSWIGLNQTQTGQYRWDDNTPFSFSAIAGPQTSDQCGSMLPNSRWRFSACSSQFAFVCRKVPVGRNTTNCECNGARDAQHRGGYCNIWDGPNRPAWCYGSSDCASAVLQANNLSRVPCFSGRGATTTPAPTVPPPPPIGCTTGQYQSGTTCQPCLTAASCSQSSRQVLVGTCGTPTIFNSPRCVTCPSNYYYQSTSSCTACDARCGTCAGPRVNDCTSCVANSSLYLFNLTTARGACIPNCHVNGRFFKDNTTQRCLPCFTANPAVDSNIQACGEFTDTTCTSTCPPGFQTMSNGCCGSCNAGITFNNVTGGTCRPVSTTCMPGQYVSGPPTSSSDLACVDCTLNQNYNVNGTGGSCVPVRRTCDPGTGQVSAPTISSDRICENCLAGTNYSNNGGPCQPTRGVCEPGSAESTSPTSTNNRVCSGCGSGTFSPGTVACTPWRGVCPAGSFQASPPSVSTDRNCTSCTLGVSYQPNPNSLSCISVTPAVCGAGQQVLAAPTLTSTRQCQNCAIGSSFSSGSGPCTGVRPLCGAGTAETALPTISSDRICTPCVLGQTYRPANSVNRQCMPVSSQCPFGYLLSAAATTSSDIVCASTTSTTTTTTTTTTTSTMTTAAPSQPQQLGGGNNSAAGGDLIPIIVILFIVFIVLVALVVYKVRGGGGPPKDDGRAAFNNPLYAHGTDFEAADEDAYTEMPVTDGLDGAYEVPVESETSGYMDVGGQDESGYMDTAPIDDDDNEDV